VHDAEEAAHVGDLKDLALSVHPAAVPRWRNMARSALALPSQRTTTHSMLDSPLLDSAVTAALAHGRPDVILAYCSGMARVAMNAPLQDVPLVLDMVDVDSAKWAALARVTAPPMGWIYRREARLLRKFEHRAASHAIANMVVTGAEKATLLGIAPSARVDVVPNGVDIEALRGEPTRAPSTTVVFCGVMNYAPNEQAALLLAREVWPLVRLRRPDAELKIVGANPSSRVQALADATTRIVVTGSVPDVRPHLWTAAIAAAPILTARGIQNKVLEAVAAGLPTVVTPNIMESLPDAVKPACVAASGARDLADAIVSLLDMTPAARHALVQSAAIDALTWERRLAPLQGILRDAATRQRDERPGTRGTDVD
jgi:sugar transferase (PEP-CTERM/EpsH1 system associated)